ncbi:MAG: hypothetical protein ABEI86_01665, partial [Halobacteriaceae archaeon]
MESDRQIAVGLFGSTLAIFILLILVVNGFRLSKLSGSSTVSALSDAVVASVAITTLYIAIEKFLMRKTHSIDVSWGLFSDQDLLKQEGVKCKILNDGPNLVTITGVWGSAISET